jgi:hypothetical protein
MKAIKIMFYFQFSCNDYNSLYLHRFPYIHWNFHPSSLPPILLAIAPTLLCDITSLSTINMQMDHLRPIYLN